MGWKLISWISSITNLSDDCTMGYYVYWLRTNIFCAGDKLGWPNAGWCCYGATSVSGRLVDCIPIWYYNAVLGSFVTFLTWMQVLPRPHTLHTFSCMVSCVIITIMHRWTVTHVSQCVTMSCSDSAVKCGLPHHIMWTFSILYVTVVRFAGASGGITGYIWSICTRYSPWEHNVDHLLAYSILTTKVTQQIREHWPLWRIMCHGTNIVVKRVRWHSCGHRASNIMSLLSSDGCNFPPSRTPCDGVSWLV